MSDHVVENNTRKEMLFVGLFQLMILGIVGLIFYGGYMRPAAPSVESLIAQAAAAADKTAEPIDASTATPSEMVSVASDATATTPAGVSPANAPLPDQVAAETVPVDPAASTNSDAAPAPAATGLAVQDPATESREVSTAVPVLTPESVTSR